MVIAKEGCYIAMSRGHCTLVQNLSPTFVFSLLLKTKCNARHFDAHETIKL